MITLRVAQYHRSQQYCNGEGELSQSFHIWFFWLRRFFSVGSVCHQFILSTSSCLSPTTSQSCDSFLQLFFGKAFLTLRLGLLAPSSACFSAVNLPELCALKTGDASAWDEAFNWLWP